MISFSQIRRIIHKDDIITGPGERPPVGDTTLTRGQCSDHDQPDKLLADDPRAHFFADENGKLMFREIPMEDGIMYTDENGQRQFRTAEGGPSLRLDSSRSEMFIRGHGDESLDDKGKKQYCYRILPTGGLQYDVEKT